jgi:Fe-S-cluster containining protein
MKSEPWFQQGLRFSCTQCGKCCGGAPGYVWVRPDDIAALCQHLGIDQEAFEQQFVRKMGLRKSLIELANGDCIFLDPKTRQCSVYEARPLQCRTWPFWESNVKTEQAWRQTCEVCPGSGQGQLYSLEKVVEQASAMRL